MVKKILQTIWKKKIATFVLLTGCVVLFTDDSLIGCALISVSIGLFDIDDK